MSFLFAGRTEESAKEIRLRRLRRGFGRISRRYDRAVLLRRLRARSFSIVLCLAIGVFIGAALWMNPRSAADIARRVAAFPDCAFARAVGAAPARRGDPGYWPHNDRDGDGIACEHWPR
jgi:hypothetical protein